MLAGLFRRKRRNCRNSTPSRRRRRITVGLLTISHMMSAILLATMMLAVQAAPQRQARIDVTGYWVSVVTEDWRWRMLTPPKGDYASLPLNA